MAVVLSEASRRILEVVAAIPRGRVASYGQIAALASLSGRARLVGWTLRHAPDDPRRPWHRVLRADGAIAFPSGSAAHDEQKRRLAREGVRVARGRVDLATFGWRRNLDELLWGPEPLAAPRGRGPAPRRRITPSTRR
jgi:methylated-DNA-protein-cysteine methyltransferase-like protein